MAAAVHPSTATPNAQAGSSTSMSTASRSKPVASSSGSSNGVLLTPTIMANYKPAKVYKSHIKEGKAYTSLSFDMTGEKCMTAAEDHAMQIFDCRTGLHRHTAYSKKYGVGLARFTHHKSNIVHTSTMESDDIRYMSLHSNTYIRYFIGHKRRVTSLEMSPADDTLLSGALDDTVRLWDVRSRSCAGMLNVAGVPSVAYDPSGMIFATALNLKPTVLLFDIRKLDSEPFADIPLNDKILERVGFPPRIPISTSVKFSNDGQHILISTSGNVHYVVHSFDYKIVARLEGHEGLEAFGQEPDRQIAPQAGISGEETSWTPDGRFVLSGSNDGRVFVWDVNPPASDTEAHKDRPPAGPDCTLMPCKVLEGHKNTPSRVVRYNPRYSMFASGGIGELAFWLTDNKDPASATQGSGQA